ncbi:unnamed protein product, partial [Choristocarpus tenellus]
MCIKTDSDLSPRRASALGVVADDKKRHRRSRIFEEGVNFSLASAQKEMAKFKGGVDLTKEIFADGNDKLVLEALENIFFMSSDLQNQMNAVLDTMGKETRSAGEWLMKEGEKGDTMYVIKSGKMEVYMKG